MRSGPQVSVLYITESVRKEESRAQMASWDVSGVKHLEGGVRLQDGNHRQGGAIKQSCLSNQVFIQ